MEGWVYKINLWWEIVVVRERTDIKSWVEVVQGRQEVRDEWRSRTVGRVGGC